MNRKGKKREKKERKQKRQREKRKPKQGLKRTQRHDRICSTAPTTRPGQSLNNNNNKQKHSLKSHNEHFLPKEPRLRSIHDYSWSCNARCRGRNREALYGARYRCASKIQRDRHLTKQTPRWLEILHSFLFILSSFSKF